MSRSNSDDFAIKELGVSNREQTWEINYVRSLLRKEFCGQHWYKKQIATEWQVA